MAFQSVVWGNSDGDIIRSGLDGSDPATLVSGLSLYFANIKLNESAGKMYVSHEAALRRFNLDGTGEEVLLSGGTVWGNPTYISLDLVNSHVYGICNQFAAPGRRISRVDLDGGNDATVASENAADQSSIVAVPSTSKLYYGKRSSPNQGIWRIDYNGSNRTKILALGGTPLEGVTSLAIDVPNSHIYFTVVVSGATVEDVRRCDIDGSNEITLYTLDNGTSPQGIDIDPDTGKLYVASFAGTITKSDLDGSNKETIFTGVPNISVATLSSVGGGGTARKTRQTSEIYRQGPGRSFGQSHHTYP